MSIDDIDIYWQCITVVEAQEILLNLRQLDWPNMNKNQREKFHKQLYKMAYPASFKEAKQVSNDHLAKILSGG